LVTRQIEGRWDAASSDALIREATHTSWALKNSRRKRSLERFVDE